MIGILLIYTIQPPLIIFRGNSKIIIHSFLQKEYKMKGYNSNKYKLTSSQFHQRQQKIIQLKLQKETFFEDILKNIYQEFERDHQELLFQQLETHNQNGKKRKRIIDKENSHTSTPISQNHIAEKENQEIPFKKLDTCIFTNQQKKIFPSRLIPQKPFSPRKFMSTPKYKQKQPQLTMQKKLFQVDSKMRRNYQRVKQRLGLKSRQDTCRIFNSIRSSLTVQRESKTQRAVRFRTEFEQGQRWVPKMLMGDLQYKTKQRKLDTRAQDRRMQCFLARYKFDQ